MEVGLKELKLNIPIGHILIEGVITLLIFIILINCLTILFDKNSFAEDKCTWVECKGYAVVENITPEQARELAKRRAQAQCIANVTGIDISSINVIKDFEFEAKLIKSFSKGVILKEEVLSWDEEKDKDRPGSSFLTLNYRACVRKLEGENDPYFNVKLEMRENTYVEGDEAVLKIYPSQNCYLTIFNITAENKVNILYPDRKYFKDNFLKGEKYFEFPPEKLRKQGWKLRVRTLPGQKENTEIIWVVATKKKIDFYNLLCKKKEGRGFCDEKNFSPTLDDLLLVLSNIPLSEKSEDIEVYVVRKK